MMSLPPHLRTYVDPNYHAPLPPQAPVSVGTNARPKAEYDWRRPEKVPVVAPVVEQKPLKLARTLGTDGRQMHIQGNTVHHPTGRQRREYPLNGNNESNNYLRRMTGADLVGNGLPAQRPQKDVVVSQHLLPGNGIGVAGEWGDTRELPGLGQEDAMRDALSIDNPHNVADGAFPVLRPDIRKWTEKPVSYAAPKDFVRERLIPDSKAGLQYKANDFAALPYYSDALPQPDALRGQRLESAEHMQLPLEKRGAARRALIDAPVPRAEPARTAVADEAPCEDVAHHVYGSQRGAPTMLKAIRRVFKKLQRPHTLDYGAGLHDDMTDDRGIHGIPVAVVGGNNDERALHSIRQRVREQPVAPLQSYTDVGSGYSHESLADHVNTSTTTRLRDDDARLASYGQVRYADDDLVQGVADAANVGSLADRALREEQYAAVREHRQQAAGVALIDVDDGVNGGGIADHVRPGSTAVQQRNDRRLVEAGNQQQLDDQVAAIMDHSRMDQAARTQRASLQDSRLIAEQYEKGGLLDNEHASQMDYARFDQTARAQRAAVQDSRLLAEQYAKGGLLDNEYASQLDYARFDHNARRAQEKRSVTYALQDDNARHSLLDSEIEQSANREAQAARVRQANVQRELQRQSAGTNNYSGQEYESYALSTGGAQVRAPRQDRAPTDDQYRGAFADETSAVADHIQIAGERERAWMLAQRDANRAIQHDSKHGIVRGAGLDGEDAASFVNLQIRAQSAPPDPVHLIVKDQHRGVSYGDAFGTSGAADALALSQLGSAAGGQQSRSRVDAMPNDAHLGGAYHAAHEQYEPSFAAQQVGYGDAGAQRSQRTRREATIHARVDNPDSDILTNTVRIGVDAPHADRAIGRLQQRERGFVELAATNSRPDEVHSIVMNEMLVAPESVHTTMSGLTDGRESSLGLKLQGRLRTETPPPASHYANNSRFGKIVTASISGTSAQQNDGKPKRSDSPLFRRRSVVAPQQ
jgi:hypothetical protein